MVVAVAVAVERVRRAKAFVCLALLRVLVRIDLDIIVRDYVIATIVYQGKCDVIAIA